MPGSRSTRARDLLRTPAGTQARVDDAVAAERTGAAPSCSAPRRRCGRRRSTSITPTIAAPIAGRIGRTTRFTLGNVVGLDLRARSTAIVEPGPDARRLSDQRSRQAGELRTRVRRLAAALDAVRVRVRFSDGTMYPEPGQVVFIDPSVASAFRHLAGARR